MAMIISDLPDGVAIVRNTSQFGDAPDRPLSLVRRSSPVGMVNTLYSRLTLEQVGRIYPLPREEAREQCPAYPRRARDKAMKAQLGNKPNDGPS